MQRVIRVLLITCAFAWGAAQTQVSARQKAAFVFEGNKVFSGQQLLDGANRPSSECSRLEEEYRPERLHRCLRAVVEFLKGEGYLRAAVGEPRQREGAEGGLTIVVPVEEGRLYRFGAVRLEGTELFSPEQLLPLFTLKPGDIARFGEITEWLGGKVRRAYADRGYIQYDYDIEPEFRPDPADANGGVVDLRVTLREGHPFVVRSIKFEERGSVPEEVLRGLMLLREGDTFNQSLYEKSIEALNQLKLFKEVDAEKDVSFIGVGRSTRFDLIIRLRGRAQP